MGSKPRGGLRRPLSLRRGLEMLLKPSPSSTLKRRNRLRISLTPTAIIIIDYEIFVMECEIFLIVDLFIASREPKILLIC